MSSSFDQTRKAVPAQLGFLAIYNPSLGTSDETIEDQIVYYSSPTNIQSRPSDQKAANDAAKREQQNEQLRQIGLAQGMVEFGRSFSAGQAVDTVETEKSRIVLHELESGWWILASINLTVLPVTAKPAPLIKDTTTEKVEAVEYSSREVKPAILLLGDLLRAHSTFLLHHASSMSALFVRTRRSKFVGILGRFWDSFIASWNVLMHGNPVTHLYGGIKIAACGELGVGVGEEERGSGEREVLEGFVGRINGLVDVVVSKFGSADPSQSTPKAEREADFLAKPTTPWLGSGNDPDAEDGAIFLGTGALSRKSVRDITHWIEDLYIHGPYAYGVLENPSSTRNSKRSKKRQPTKLSSTAENESRSHRTYDGDDREPLSPIRDDLMTTLPPQPVGDSDESTSSRRRKLRRPTCQRGPGSYASTDSETKKGNKYVRYLKFGYGTHWSIGGASSKPDEAMESTDTGSGKRLSAPEVFPSPGNNGSQAQSIPSGDKKSVTQDDSKPHYLIGLVGDIENDDDDDHESEGGEHMSSDNYNSRLLLRTLTLELEREEDARAEADISIDLGNGDQEHTSMHAKSDHTNTTVSSYDSQDRNKTKKLRVVVYVNRPFIFVFLFELRTESLALGNLYWSMHYQLAPLIKPLLISTTFRATKPEVTNTEDSTTPIYDLVWDPNLRTINSTIPNIPDPYHVSDTEIPAPWSRMDALNTHMQIINTYIASTADRSDLERTCKTSRGWWIVWTSIPQDESTPTVSLASGPVKVPSMIHEDSGESEDIDPRGPTHRGKNQAASGNASTVVSSLVSGPAHPFLDSPDNSPDQTRKEKEIILVRRASDHVASKSRLLTGSAFTGVESGWTATPSKLAQGIGVDTKKYIDGLLNLNR